MLARFAVVAQQLRGAFTPTSRIGDAPGMPSPAPSMLPSPFTVGQAAAVESEEDRRARELKERQVSLAWVEALKWKCVLLCAGLRPCRVLLPVAAFTGEATEERRRRARQVSRWQLSGMP